MSARKQRRSAPSKHRHARGAHKASPREQKQFLELYDALAFTRAERYADTLTLRYPKDAFAWKVLGSCLHKNGKAEAARNALQRSVALGNQDAQAQHLLARALYDLGEPLQALTSARCAIALEPAFAQGHMTMAEILSESDFDEEALEHAVLAQQHGHSLMACLFIKSHIFLKRRRYRESFEVAQRLVELDPNNPYARNEIGNVYKDLGQYGEAESAFRKALALKPDMDTAFLNLLITMHYNPGCDRVQIRNTILEWERYLAGPINKFAHSANLHSANRPLRIGLVSPGFRKHPVGLMVQPALSQLGSDFELHFYSTNNADDDLTQRLKESATSWHLVRHLSQEALAEQIAQDDIDILIDLAGFGEGSRLRTMARKPAPIIVKWVGGLINTMGVSEFDYLLSDNYETPQGADEWYSEKLIRMPDDYICYLPAPNAPAVTALPAITNGHITLGCFNNPAKINAELLAQWATLMHALPNSRLFLKSGQYDNAEYSQNIRTVMGEHGIAADRLIMEGPAKHRELLEAYNRVDIALDTWPYSGGLTTCEAFMMGVPVVTLPGPTFAGRHSATHLINAGMPELVTANWDEYRERVVELAADLPQLSLIRACLRQFLIQSPVCDAERYAKHFSDAMRAIWQRHCEGETPAALTLTQQGQAYFEDDPNPVVFAPSNESAPGNSEFKWEFQGKIIAVDNGGQTLNTPAMQDLLERGIAELVVFDPASREQKNATSERPGVYYYAHNSLGDGKEATLRACLDAGSSSLLEPLAYQNGKDGSTVLARLPLSTVALDDIEGLPSLEWLVIDELSDSAAILESGKKALAETLLIQVGVSFQPTHENQTDLASLQGWATRNGFRFYRLHEPEDQNRIPQEQPENSYLDSALVTAQALLLPDQERIRTLDVNQATKLAFLLHTIYDMQDAAGALLSDDSRQRYRASVAEKQIATAASDVASPAWQPLVRELLLANRPLNQKLHGLPGELVVSLTSFPARFATLWATVSSLLSQSVRADRVVLWIAHDDARHLPDNVLTLAKHELEIRYCENLRSYKKIIPALEQFEDAYIATADDDIYYPPTWLEELVHATNAGSKEIAAHRIHRIRLNTRKEVLPYKEWEWNATQANNADALNFPTGVAGVLYPPGCFHTDVTDSGRFNALCPNADDIWLYAMARLKGYSFKHTGRRGFVTWPGSQAQTLFSTNSIGGNDRQFFKLYKHYESYGVLPAPSNQLYDGASDEKIKDRIRRPSFQYKETSVYFCLPDLNDHIQKILHHSRCFYELDMLEDIAKIVQKGDTVLDIGANIGNHSVFLGLFTGAEKIYAFEPHPKTSSILRENLEANNLNNKVTVVQKGVSSESGKASFTYYDESNTGMSQLSKNATGEIETIALDQVMGDDKGRISVVKMDIEGMELAALKGAIKTLQHHSPVLYVEAGEEDYFKQVESFLAGYQYAVKARFNATATYKFERCLKSEWGQVYSQRKS